MKWKQAIWVDFDLLVSPFGILRMRARPQVRRQVSGLPDFIEWRGTLCSTSDTEEANSTYIKYPSSKFI